MTSTSTTSNNEPTTAITDLVSTVTRWRVWVLMGMQDINMRYRRSVLGPFWISLTMAVMILALAYLYGQILHQPFKQYLPYLACGLLAWNFISSMIIDSGGLAAESENHLKSVPVPFPIFAARMVFRNLVIFGHNAIAVILILAFFGVSLTFTALAAIVGVAIYAVGGFCTGLVLGPVSARFRDIPQVTSNLVQIAFFVTPIIWMPSATSTRPLLANANPFYHLIELLRAPMLGHLPTPLNWEVSLSIVIAAAVCAYLSLVITRTQLYRWL